MTSLEDHCHGMSLAGAGGGGYLYALKTSPEFVEGLTCDHVEVDQQGLEVWVGGENVLQKSQVEETLTHAKLNTLIQQCK